MYDDFISYDIERKRNAYQSQEKEICKECEDRAGLPCLFVFDCDKLKHAMEIYWALKEYDDKIERGELVEVVRCRECLCAHQSCDEGFIECDQDNGIYSAEYYCASGERSVENEND